MIGVPSTRISIHAPREGGDVYHLLTFLSFSPISIHAPREGGDKTFCNCDC